MMLMAACEQEQPTKITNLSNSYLPLEIGNECRYKCYTSFDDTFDLYFKVTNKTTFNGKEYFKIELNLYFNSAGPIDSILYIRTTDNVFYYKYINGNDYIYKIFKDTVLEHNENTPFMKVRLDVHGPIQTPVGDFESILVEEGLGTEPSLLYYSNSIGLIKRAWFGGYFEMIYAKVNGKIYE
jgi:hypothetical protein